MHRGLRSAFRAARPTTKHPNPAPNPNPTPKPKTGPGTARFTQYIHFEPRLQNRHHNSCGAVCTVHLNAKPRARPDAGKKTNATRWDHELRLWAGSGAVAR